MGRWGDGEMGRWGDGEMGRWGDGEMVEHFLRAELNGFDIRREERTTALVN
ncbi:MAG: hypothetical protein F6K23_15535 [Okeania sp. SIO2C9]|uniref:hypothetical protein n=1 Tax=Okeania sp. SIO2C9 TaxID=2607791 RepID=UPI0013C1B0EA|nr:hypothetical protein [Okeania sp. SIO2C9]NEQ74325.1 hypothetical protein [Okeania sp. SIO2C9]